MAEPAQRVVIITGMSGAGKSTALRCFEDMGYLCVDNIPPQIIEAFLKLLAQSETSPPGVAFVCDIRSGALFDDFHRVWAELAAMDVSPRVIFLDSDNATLVRRYKELRRQHPLTQGGISNEAAIARERERLEPLKTLAAEVIDTTNLTSKQLTGALRELFVAGDRLSYVTLTLLSFGYKYGVPADADFIFDLRFLPNPFYVEELKDLTGRDKAVYDFVMKDERAVWAGERILEFIEGTLPGFEAVQKFNLLVALGCTGGKHRSVAVVNWLKERFAEHDRRALVIHRDVEKL
jgi:UPF0042 nucleotide-binding protein